MPQMTESTRGRHPLSDVWSAFHRRLANALAAMNEDQFLILQEEHRGRYMQFASRGLEGMWGEVVSNRFLEPGRRLTIDDLARLRALGWDDPSPEGGDGLPNHSQRWDAPIRPDWIACIAVHTIIEALGIVHPDQFEYVAFEADGAPIPLAVLGLDVASPPSVSRD